MPNHPLETRRRWTRIGIVFGLWTAFGIYSAFNTQYRTTLWGRPYGWGRAFYAEVAFAWTGAAFTPLILYMARRFRFPDRHWRRNAAAHIVGAFLFAAVAKLVWDLVVRPPRAFWVQGWSAKGVVSSILNAVDSGVLLYAVVVLTATAWDYYRRYEEGRVTASRLQQQFAQAHIRALRMQLQPHFLFNTLHAISGLIHEDPRAAERMIARLSEFLRMSLEETGLQEVRLERELHFLRLYLDIERVRFEERLRVGFDISGEALDALVPNLVLQPLVENAIRHGISQRISGGEIAIRAYKKGDELHLTVSDDGAGAGDPLRREGVGLSNTRARLRGLYGDRQRFTLAQRPGGGTEATIAIPYTPAGNGEVAVCAS